MIGLTFVCGSVVLLVNALSTRHLVGLCGGADRSQWVRTCPVVYLDLLVQKFMIEFLIHAAHGFNRLRSRMKSVMCM